MGMRGKDNETGLYLLVFGVVHGCCIQCHGGVTWVIPDFIHTNVSPVFMEKCCGGDIDAVGR